MFALWLLNLSLIFLRPEVGGNKIQKCVFCLRLHSKNHCLTVNDRFMQLIMCQVPTNLSSRTSEWQIIYRLVLFYISPHNQLFVRHIKAESLPEDDEKRLEMLQIKVTSKCSNVTDDSAILHLQPFSKVPEIVCFKNL